MTKSNKVANGGSAIGEAIGHYMESIIQTYIKDFLIDYNCHFLAATGYNPITNKTSKKLLLYDKLGNDYNVDGIITNESMQPLILLESKYIRYKKHNRDKGSWICNAHSAIRRRYPSIRGSVAVLAGNWSKSSLAMIKSYDVNIFLISFDFIADLLQERSINFRWEEKDTEGALLAWNKYSNLSENEKIEIAVKMVDSIKDQLFCVLGDLLDDNKPREVKKVDVEIVTTLGETNSKSFTSVEDATEYLHTLSLDELFDPSVFTTIFDVPEDPFID